MRCWLAVSRNDLPAADHKDAPVATQRDGIAKIRPQGLGARDLGTHCNVCVVDAWMKTEVWVDDDTPAPQTPTYLAPTGSTCPAVVVEARKGHGEEPREGRKTETKQGALTILYM